MSTHTILYYNQSMYCVIFAFFSIQIVFLALLKYLFDIFGSIYSCSHSY